MQWLNRNASAPFIDAARAGRCAVMFFALICFGATSSRGDEWFVAPDGRSGNNGTSESPWDLESAISGVKPVKPGDVVWLRKGTYRNDKREFTAQIAGAPGKEVIVRNYRSERATIDGALNVEGSDLWVWGLEVMVSDPRPDKPMPAGSSPKELKRPWGGIHSRTGVRSKIINCVLHDNNQGFSYWIGAIDGEIYGCIIYRNGWIGVDRAHGHAIYTQNDKGTKRIVDNIMFDPYSYLLHAYGSSRAYVNGYHVEGNVFFGGPVLIGGGRPSERIEFVGNYTYDAGTRVGYAAPYNLDCHVAGNYFAGNLDINRYRRFTVTDNDFVLSAAGNVSVPKDGEIEKGVWDENRYSVSAMSRIGSWRNKTGFDRNSSVEEMPEGRPARNKVVIRPNRFENGRANVAVYNWEGKDREHVDLSGILKPGQSFEIRNVQDYFGNPVAKGDYERGTVEVPLLRGRLKKDLKLAGDAEGRTWRTFGDYTEFDAFVVLPTAAE